MSESRWGVVYCKPVSECRAQRSIVQAGFRSYCPMRRTLLTGHRQGRGEVVLRPLFPRYLFAELDGGRFHGVLYSGGVIDLVRDSEGMPATLGGEIIDDLRERERDGEFDDLPRPAIREHFSAGQSVKITGGDWGGLVGTFGKLDSQTRATVLIEFLGRQNVAARVSRDLLVAAE